MIEKQSQQKMFRLHNDWLCCSEEYAHVRELAAILGIHLPAAVRMRGRRERKWARKNA